MRDRAIGLQWVAAGAAGETTAGWAAGGSREDGAHIAAARAAAVVGDREAVEANVAAMTDDMRRSIKLADATRPIDREAARIATKRVGGVRSAAWLDRELAPGDRALLQQDRQIDALAPDIRAQHRANQALEAERDSEEAKRRQEESLRIMEKTTPEM